MKKLLNSDWLRGVQLCSANYSANYQNKSGAWKEAGKINMAASIIDVIFHFLTTFCTQCKQCLNGVGEYEGVFHVYY